MSETRQTENIRIPKTLIKKMREDGFMENFGYYLEEIYNQKSHSYNAGVVL